jgi:recombination protein RecR
VNQQQMLRQVQQMQAAMAQAQQEIAATEVTGSAGGGMVTATVTGNGDLKSIKIDPAAVDPDDVEMLEDLVVAAVTEARRSAEQLTQEKMGAITGGLGNLMGGMGLNLPGMQMLPPSAERLVTELERLPGVGRRTAQRLAFHLLRVPEPEALGLAEALRDVRERIGFCTICSSLAEGDICVTCADPRRDRTLICVVETPSDVVPIERTASYRGLYHVLGGALSPIDGVDPGDLRIAELVRRVEAGGIEEVIVATNPTMTGEATASYLATLLRPHTRVTRLASGLPVGGDLEFADEVTIGRALSGRRDL